MTDDGAAEREGGESACFAHLICPECGIVLDGATHVQGCTWVEPESGLDAMDSFEPAPGD
jgi:hypothetical protein